MTNNNHNPIIDIVKEILVQTDTGISEYELIKQIRQRVPVFNQPQQQDEKLTLFQNHFMVMNALYDLQKRLLSDNLYVSISVLDIRLEIIGQEARQALVSNPAEQKLRDYYLDWNNLADTNAADVKQLISSFWQTYLAQDKRLQALQQLDLPADSNWESVKQQYRRLAAAHHPDKGGDQNRFTQIRQAYEILQRCQID